jgi:hypothetical protein
MLWARTATSKRAAPLRTSIKTLSTEITSILPSQAHPRMLPAIFCSLLTNDLLRLRSVSHLLGSSALAHRWSLLKFIVATSLCWAVSPRHGSRVPFRSGNLVLADPAGRRGFPQFHGGGACGALRFACPTCAKRRGIGSSQREHKGGEGFAAYRIALVGIKAWASKPSLRIKQVEGVLIVAPPHQG